MQRADDASSIYQFSASVWARDADSTWLRCCYWDEELWRDAHKGFATREPIATNPGEGGRIEGKVG